MTEGKVCHLLAMDIIVPGNITAVEDEDIEAGVLQQDDYIIALSILGALTFLMSIAGVAINAINIKTFYAILSPNNGLSVSFLGMSIADMFASLLSCGIGVALCMEAHEIKVGDPYKYDPLFFAIALLNTSSVATVINVITTSWIAVARCMCVVRPFNFKRRFTMGRSIAAMTISAVCIVSVYVPMLFTNGLGEALDTASGKMIYTTCFAPNRSMVKNLVFLVTQTIIPVAAQVLVILCVIVMTYSLHFSAKFQFKESQSSALKEIAKQLKDNTGAKSDPPKDDADKTAETKNDSTVEPDPTEAITDSVIPDSERTEIKEINSVQVSLKPDDQNRSNINNSYMTNSELSYSPKVPVLSPVSKAFQRLSQPRETTEKVKRLNRMKVIKTEIPLQYFDRNTLQFLNDVNHENPMLPFHSSSCVHSAAQIGDCRQDTSHISEFLGNQRCVLCVDSLQLSALETSTAEKQSLFCDPKQQVSQLPVVENNDQRVKILYSTFDLHMKDINSPSLEAYDLEKTYASSKLNEKAKNAPVVETRMEGISKGSRDLTLKETTSPYLATYNGENSFASCDLDQKAKNPPVPETLNASLNINNNTDEIPKQEFKVELDELEDPITDPMDDGDSTSIDSSSMTEEFKAAPRTRKKTVCMQQRRGTHHKRSILKRLRTNDQRVVRQVIHICVIFIIFNMPMILISLASPLIPDFDFYGRLMRLYIILHYVKRLLEQIGSNINIVIYLKYNSNYRSLNQNLFPCIHESEE